MIFLFDRLDSDAQEYYINFQPAPPFVLEMKGDCQGKVPLAGEIKNCLAEFRLPTPPAPVSVPAPDSTPTPTITPEPIPEPVSIQSTCTEDIWFCGDYGVCSVAGIQSRNCTKTFDCPNVQTVMPTTGISCQFPIQNNQQKQDSVTNPILEKIDPNKSEAIPVVIKNTTQNSPRAPSGVIEKTVPNQIKKIIPNTKVKPLIQNQNDKSIKLNQEVKQNNNSVSAQIGNQLKPSLVKRFINWITRWFN